MNYLVAWLMAFNVVIVDVAPVAPDLSNMASITLRERIEQARCVTNYALRPVADTLFIDVKRLGPAEVAKTDSLTVWAYQTRDAQGYMGYHLCNDTLPTIHSHIVDNGWLDRPTPIDTTEAMQRPFALLLSVINDSTYRVHLYGLKPN